MEAVLILLIFVGHQPFPVSFWQGVSIHNTMGFTAALQHAQLRRQSGGKFMYVIVTCSYYVTCRNYYGCPSAGFSITSAEHRYVRMYAGANLLSAGNRCAKASYVCSIYI